MSKRRLTEDLSAEMFFYLQEKALMFQKKEDRFVSVVEIIRNLIEQDMKQWRKEKGT